MSTERPDDFMRIVCPQVLVFFALGPVVLNGQTASRDSSRVAVIHQLFAAMKASDTSATRAAFVANARIINVPGGAASQSAGKGLTVDQFVAFVGKNPVGSWIERAWSPTERVSGPIADLWFDYDVYRGSTLDHCGVNAVQLQETTEGWKILTMSFTSVANACPAHAPPS